MIEIILENRIINSYFQNKEDLRYIFTQRLFAFAANNLPLLANPKSVSCFLGCHNILENKKALLTYVGRAFFIAIIAIYVGSHHYANPAYRGLFPTRGVVFGTTPDMVRFSLKKNFHKRVV